jgi:lysophospholipase L1-like esterase
MADIFILVFGTSNEWGAWDPEGGGWVQRLKSVTDKKSLSQKDRCWMTYNLGVSGDNSRDLLKRIGNDIRSRTKEKDDSDEIHIIINIGTNDSYIWNMENRFNVPPSEFKNNLEKILKVCRDHTKNIAFLGLHPTDARADPVPWRTEISYRKDSAMTYNNIVRDFCSENGVSFIDSFSIFDGREKELLEDGCHPNSKGHEMIFGLVLKFLEKNRLI